MRPKSARSASSTGVLLRIPSVSPMFIPPNKKGRLPFWAIPACEFPILLSRLDGFPYTIPRVKRA